MKPEHPSAEIYKGAFILTVAALLTKILSAIYRVPFQNIVGDVGFYIYQQVYPFYGVVLVLSTYGFPVVISKLYVERAVRQDTEGIKKLYFLAVLVLSLLGITAFFTLFFGANALSAYMKDPQLAILFKTISFVFLLFPMLSLLRGNFQGKGEMFPTAVSQVGEQLFRVMTILMAAFFLTKHGQSLYVVGSGAMFGSITGGMISLLILLAFIRFRRDKVNRLVYTWKDLKGSRKIAKALIIQGFAISISSMILIFIQLADSLNLYSLLLSAGINGEAAKELKGIYDRGQPLIQIGTVITTSLSLSLVPLISSAKLRKQTNQLIGKIRFALQIGLFIGVGASIGLWSIMEPTNKMLFENGSGTHVLSVLSLMIVSSSLIMTCTAILQGLGFTLYPAFVILCGFCVKYAVNIVFIPLWGIMGAAIASNASLLFILLLLFIKLRIELKESIFTLRSIFLIGFAGIMMMLVLKGYLSLTNLLYGAKETSRRFACFQALSSIFIGGYTFLFFVIKVALFKEEELSLLPFGKKILLLIPKKSRR
ncbi:oligosaccharide flippase family protein [Bacillus sp. 03113]|uniref:putative polysaccharide biosynthesis protein n=1 Tax=Bacillus sp. 03113 TaxID=2578211 RepID=UPI001144CF4D|nr:oligosaccharide flippase family protein [Bacillus sp. 03113]